MADLAADTDAFQLQVPAHTVGKESTRLRIGSFVRDLALAGAAPGIFPTGTAAVRGAVLTLIATGEGLSRLPVAITLGGLPAEVLFTGTAADAPGLLQIQARVPADLPAGKAAVVMTVGSISSPAVTVAVE